MFCHLGTKAWHAPPHRVEQIHEHISQKPWHKNIYATIMLFCGLNVFTMTVRMCLFNRWFSIAGNGVDDNSLWQRAVLLNIYNLALSNLPVNHQCFYSIYYFGSTLFISSMFIISDLRVFFSFFFVSVILSSNHCLLTRPFLAENCC